MFDLSKTINKVQASFKKDERRASQIGIGNNLEIMSTDPADYVVMPDWWNEYFGVMGLPISKFVQVSGRPDSGKTTLCLIAMKRAQEQGFIVVYVETEGKTSEQDLISAGIDPNGVIVVNTAITEEVFDNSMRILKAVKDDYPDAKVLLVIDSYGNTVSMKDSEINLTEKVSQVGGAAKTNRVGIGAIKAQMLKQKIACLVVNYSYANIGSVGETNAGGRALEFMCGLILNAARTGNYEVSRDSVKVKAGINGVYKVTKNHFTKGQLDADGKPKLFPKQMNFRISAEGFKILPPKKGQ
jgi:RecA/RadA recombinase